MSISHICGINHLDTLNGYEEILTIERIFITGWKLHCQFSQLLVYQ